MHTKTLSTLFVLASFLPVVGCDVRDDSIDELDDVVVEIDELDIEMRATAGPIGEPYHGRWEGEAGVVTYPVTYDVTIILAPGFCTLSGNNVYAAQWDYGNIGTCTSSLEYLGTSVAADGTKTWTFSDNNLTGPCDDGFVELTETADPTEMQYTWRWPSGSIDAQGVVARTGMCGG